MGARPSVLRAQDTTRATSPDSLAERLRRAEEAIELLRRQLETQAASTVQSATRVRVEIFGRVLMNAFSNSSRVNNADVPSFTQRGGGRGGLGATIRQTSVGVAVTVPRVLGGGFAGDLHMDFFGGQQPGSGSRHLPIMRVRTARGIVRWSRAELLFGQDAPLMAGLNPVSIASFGSPDFAAAGNLWLWLPQVRFTGELGTPLKLAVQGALLAPTSSEPAGSFDTDTDIDIAERSRRPYVQARVRARWGAEDAPGEIGIGAHKGWLRRGDGSNVSSDGVAIDARIPLGGAVELRGEAYTGQALRGLGGAGIGQLFTTDSAAVYDRGGWAQIVVRASPLLELGAGCGVADPRDRNLPAQRLENAGCEAHTIVRPGGPMIAGLTYRTQRTTFPEGKVRNHHVNLAVGFEF
ncbi:MAG TPA: hypothetical protein VJ803_02420 [Gemmatimonadaceae bacterium]|nr:hypothetical protein [Gemmatimonadaceae bacterium]